MAKKSIIDLDLIPSGSKKINLILKQKQFNNLVLDIIKNENLKPEFKNLKVFTLGSLSYGGLCPYSDVDLLAVGEKPLAEKFSLSLQAKLSNVKIKWWADFNSSSNFSEDIFDQISLFFAKSIHESDLKSEMQELLNFKVLQSDWIQKNLDRFQADLSKDRNLRRSRYGAVGGELSPNLKYGPGGLRDSCQALAWVGWQKKSSPPERAERLANERRSLSAGSSEGAGRAKPPKERPSELDIITNTLNQNLTLIYQTRFALQYHFQSDQLTQENWLELLKDLNWLDEGKKFFYQTLFQQFKLTDVIFENPKSDLSAEIKILEDKFSDLFTDKHNDPKLMLSSLDFVTPNNAKLTAYYLKTQCFDKPNVFYTAELKAEIYNWIHQLFLEPNLDWQIDFILDSNLVAVILPEWNYICGLVQSDHYHKYTVSEHLRQTLKSVGLLQTQKELRFSMQTSCEEVSAADWQSLKWIAIFHDLKKGYPEDHSILGKQAVEKFDYFNEDQKKLVGSVVENHLRLSTFAFRYEHSDQQQLQILNELFEVSHWIRLLLVFTGADIMGSNPQAWNKWKSDQLYFAYKSLMDFRNEKISRDVEDVEGFELSPYLVSVFGSEMLKEDIVLLKQNKNDDGLLEDWQVMSIDGNLWIRVFKKDQGPGTLSDILNVLYLVGLPVEQAFISGKSSSEACEGAKPLVSKPSELDSSGKSSSEPRVKANEVRHAGASELDSSQTQSSFTSSPADGAQVYNWFRLPTTFVKPEQQIRSRIKIVLKQKVFNKKNLVAQIDRVIFLTENNDKLSFVFKGRDQSGVLLYICKIFESLEVDILKAQINTWGQRIEDLFVVKKGEYSAEILLDLLNQRLNLPQSIKI